MDFLLPFKEIEMRSMILGLVVAVGGAVNLQAGECNGSCALPVRNAVVKVVEAPVHLVGNVVRGTVGVAKNVACRTKQRTQRLFGRLRCL